MGLVKALKRVGHKIEDRLAPGQQNDAAPVYAPASVPVDTPSVRTTGAPVPVVTGPTYNPPPQDSASGVTRPRTTGVSTGLTDPGNLNPYNRTILKNPDGSISTTSSTGVGTDKGETIIPTVVDGVRLTPEQAMAEFRKTGGNFGSYRTVEQGDAAATALHNDQAAYLEKNGIGTNGNDTRSRRVGPTYNPGENTPMMRPQQQPETMASITASRRPEDMVRDRRVEPEPPNPDPVVVYDNKGRPQSAEGGADDFSRQQAYLRALEAYKPENHNSRGKSGLIQFGRGLLHGHGLLPSIAEGVEGVVDPKVDEEYQHRVDVARATRPVAAEQARRKAASDLAGDAADRTYKSAQAYRALNPVYAPHVIEDSSQGPGVVNPNNNSFSPIYDPQGNAVGRKPGAVKPTLVNRVNPKTGRKEQYQVEPGNADKLVAVETEDGLMVPPGTERSARATESERTYTHGRNAVKDNQDVQWHDETKTGEEQKTFTQVKEHAGAIVGKLNSAREHWKTADAMVTKTQKRLAEAKTPEDKVKVQDLLDGYEYQRTIAAQDAAGAANELNTAHGDIYEAGVADKDENGNPSGGLAYYKIKPFTVAWWRTKYPHATKAQQDAAIQNARDLGQTVIFPKDSRANK